MCSIDMHWNEVKTKEKNEMKAQEKTTKRIWKKMDMNTEAPVYNRYRFLGEDEEYPGGEQGWIPIMNLETHMEKNSTVTTSTSPSVHKIIKAKTLKKNGTVTTNPKIMEIMTMGAQEKPRADNMRAFGKGRITIDSGAAESVIQKEMLTGLVPTRESPMKGTVYTAADGGQMWNHGCKQLHFRSAGEVDTNSAEFQCTTVTKPLASVARIAAKGNRVVLEEDGGYIENKVSGKRIPIIRDRGTYAIEVEYMVPAPMVQNTTVQNNTSGFTRQW